MPLAKLMIKSTKGSALEFIPASHENTDDPGVYKKILVKRGDVPKGNLQMINWARMPSGKSFRKHYHEDLEEIFIIIEGTTELRAGDETLILHKGDSVCIPPRITHTMKNISDDDAFYIVVGITSGTGGRTVTVEG